MNKHQRQLGLLVSVILSLILILEFSRYRTVQSGVIADQTKILGNLTKGTESIPISSGQWLVAVRGSHNAVVGRGKLISFEWDAESGVGMLYLGDHKDSTRVQSNTINTLYIGHARELGRRGGKAFIAGAGLGAIIGAIFYAQDDYLGPGLIPLCAGIDGAALGVLGVLGGGLRHLGSDEYALGPNQWTLTPVIGPITPLISPAENP